MRLSTFCLAAVALTLVVAGSLEAGEQNFKFSDKTKEAGLLPMVEGNRGHGAGWGDVDGDGWIDLYMATFHNEGSKPNMFFRNQGGQFKLDDQEALRISTRGTGVVFVDLDNDGDLDLYVGAMSLADDSKIVEKEGHTFSSSSMFRNDGGGQFTNISEQCGACPDAFGGRSVAALDYDGDGLLDLLVGEDPYKGKKDKEGNDKPGYNGSMTCTSRLFHNLGKLKFEDVTSSVGIPVDAAGLGVATADVNNDTFPDFFLCSGSGGNRLFVNDGHGHFHEPKGSFETFAWPKSKGDDMVCGITFGDVNRDGLLDAYIGQHFSHPWSEPVADRLYINRGQKDGDVVFEDVTEKVGLVPLPLKAPHVEIQDFDNDGLPDLYCSFLKFVDGTPYPMIFKNKGIKDGLPQFDQTVLAVNDFPTEEDVAIKQSGAFFDKLAKDGKALYTAPGPTADYDNDGRLDIFLGNWWIELPSYLLHNDTEGGNWVQVVIAAPEGVNRQGIGSRINVYPAGSLGKTDALIGDREMVVGTGYASGQPAIAHFGLGKAQAVDIEVILPNKKGTIVKKNVKANQRVTVGPE